MLLNVQITILESEKYIYVEKWAFYVIEIGLFGRKAKQATCALDHRNSTKLNILFVLCEN